MVYWIHYIEKIDNLICNALVLNCRCSLENILELSVGDGSGPVPVILIHVSLKDNQVTCNYLIIEKSMLLTTLLHCVIIRLYIHRVYQKF